MKASILHPFLTTSSMFLQSPGIRALCFSLVPTVRLLIVYIQAWLVLPKYIIVHASICHFSAHPTNSSEAKDQPPHYKQHTNPCVIWKLTNCTLTFTSSLSMYAANSNKPSTDPRCIPPTQANHKDNPGLDHCPLPLIAKPVRFANLPLHFGPISHVGPCQSTSWSPCRPHQMCDSDTTGQSVWQPPLTGVITNSRCEPSKQAWSSLIHSLLNHHCCWV